MIPKTVNDFFCGCGGFAVGFKAAGFDIVGAWDFDKYAVETYRANVGDHVKQADVSKMTAEDLPKATVWTFGFPCQDLSVAGKMKGMKLECQDCGHEWKAETQEHTVCPSCGGTNYKAASRSGLFFEMMRLLDETPEGDKPLYLVAENVKGLKPYIPILEEEYKKRGYTPHIKLFNSKYHGVPQNRERYYIVGTKDSANLTFSFHEEDTSFIPKLSTILEKEVDDRFYIADEKAQKIISQAMEKLSAKGSVHATITPDRIEKRQNGRRAKEDEEEMFTLTAQDRHGVMEQIDGQMSLDMHGIPFSQRSETFGGNHFYENGCTGTCLSRDYKDPMRVIEEQPQITSVGNTNPSQRGMNGNVYHEEGLSPTLTTNKGDGIKVLQKEELPKINQLAHKGSGGQKGYIHDTNGIVGTATATDYKNPKLILEEQPGIDVVGMAEGINGHDILKRVYNPEGLSPTLNACGGGNTQPKVLVNDGDVKRIDIPQTVSVRKYPVDTEKLVETLREHKRLYGYTNNALADGLNVPLTKVEHWFRTDDGFAIPDAEVWPQLKAMLRIETDEFDDPITVFEEKEGTFDSSERHYMTHGVSPTLTCATSPKIIENPRYRVRKLTPLEYGRLQGFPMDTWKQVVSNSQAYKQFGNAVTTFVAQDVAESIAESMGEVLIPSNSVELESESACETPSMIADDMYLGRPPRIYDETAPTLRSERNGLKVLVPDGGIEKQENSVEGESIRDHIKCVNPRREDGIQTRQHARVYETDGIAPAISAQDNGRMNILEEQEKKNPLEEYTTDQLIAEIIRRAGMAV